MYIYIHAYIYTYIYTYVYVYTYVYMHAHPHSYIHTRTYNQPQGFSANVYRTDGSPVSMTDGWHGPMIIHYIAWDYFKHKVAGRFSQKRALQYFYILHGIET